VKLLTLGIFLATKAAGAAALAMLNRTLRLDDLPPTLPGASHDWPWKHGRVRYTTLGDGPPVVLLHGVHAAASSFEMRQIFEPLSRHFTVYAVDLLGFGKSERPDVHYSGDMYVELVRDFLTEIVRAPTSIVASSLSASYAASAAASAPDSVERLVLICPTGEVGITSSGLRSELVYWFLRSPLNGEAAFNALVSRASIRAFLEKRVYANPARVTDVLVDQQWATAHQPNARFAPAAFIGRRLNIPLHARLARAPRPALLVWGEASSFTPPSDATPLLAASPRATLAVIPDAGGLPHDEQPERFLEIVLPFLQGTPASHPAEPR